MAQRKPKTIINKLGKSKFLKRLIKMTDRMRRKQTTNTASKKSGNSANTTDR